MVEFYNEQRIKDDNRDITLLYKFKRGRSYYWKIKCNICGFDSTKIVYRGGKETNNGIREDNLRKGVGCPCCSNSVVQTGINDIATTHPWMIPIFRDKSYILSYGSEVLCDAWCDDCGRKFEKKISPELIKRYGKVQCICKDGLSKPNKIIRYIADCSPFTVVTEARFPTWFKHCNNGHLYRYDALFPEIKLFVEMDHKLGHVNGKVMKGSKYSLDDRIKIDYEKESQAIKHGYNIIRVDCGVPENRYDLLKQNIEKSNILQLLNIDMNKFRWDKLYKAINANNVAIAAKLYESGISEKDIAEKLHLSKDTIRNYLFQAKDAKMITYREREQRKNRYVLNNEYGYFFKNHKSAMKWCGMKSDLISQFLQGLIEYAGISPIDNSTKLTWRYVYELE